MLCTYALKAFAEKLNEIKVYDAGINPMKKFAGTTTENTIKNHHRWGCPIYVLYEILRGKISGLTKWEPISREGIYLGHLSFHAGPVALFLNPETGHVSHPFHVVLDDEFSTVLFIR